MAEHAHVNVNLAVDSIVIYAHNWVVAPLKWCVPFLFSDRQQKNNEEAFNILEHAMAICDIDDICLYGQYAVPQPKYQERGQNKRPRMIGA